MIKGDFVRNSEMLSEDMKEEHLIALHQHSDKEDAFRTFMDKMNLAEKSVQENGYYSEEEVEEELGRADG